MLRNIRQIYAVLDVRQRWQSLLLLFLSLCEMAIETLSIGMAIPVLTSFTGADNADLPLPGFIDDQLKMFDASERVLVMAGLLVVIFLLRGILVVGISWIRLTYIANVRTSISERLFLSFLLRDFGFHLKQNSSALVRNVVSEATAFAGLLNSGFIFISDFLVVTALSVLLLTVLPLESASTIAILTLAWLIFYFVVGRRLKKWGKVRVKSDGRRLQHTQQGLGAYREVKLLGREEEFVRFYQPYNVLSAHMAKLQSFAKSIPRVLFEISLIFAIFIIVLLQTTGGTPPAEQVAKLGLFAVAAFRILPSVNRLASGYNAIKYGHAVIDLVHEGITPDLAAQRNRQHAVAPLEFTDSVRFKDVSFTHPDATHVLLRNIDFVLKKGETIGLIGPSGSGKSTFVDLFLGILRPDTGTIEVDGKDVTENLRAWQRSIGYVAQSVSITDDTLAQNIAFGVPADKIDRTRVAEVIRMAHLDDLIAEHPAGIDMPLGESGTKLSGGQRQRVGIARALYHDPQVLVLDEITSALDGETEKNIVRVLEEMHGMKSMLIVSHRHSTLTGCDRIFSLGNGRISEVDKHSLIAG